MDFQIEVNTRVDDDETGVIETNYDTNILGAFEIFVVTEKNRASILEDIEQYGEAVFYVGDMEVSFIKLG